MSSSINSPLVPNLVWAHRPIFGGDLQLLCDPHTIAAIRSLGSNAKMGEYWGLVHANPGPRPDGVAHLETGGLKEPVAIFRGLRGPVHDLDDKANRDIFVYVTNPAQTYWFQKTSEGGAILPQPRPVDSVFTTFVSFAADHVDQALGSMKKQPSDRPAGVILFWEWTQSAPNDGHLPHGFRARYEARMQ